MALSNLSTEVVRSMLNQEIHIEVGEALLIKNKENQQLDLVLLAQAEI
jgi:hypothetical protein